MDAGDIV